MFCYPFLELLSGVMQHLQLRALVIPYSGNTYVRCDPAFSLDTFYVNKCNFCYPFLSLLGVAFYINTCQFCYPFLLSLLGLRSGVKPSLGYLHWSVLTRRSLMYAMSVILTLVLLHK